MEEGEEICVDISGNNYHLALDGKTFAVLMEYAPHLVPRVSKYILWLLFIHNFPQTIEELSSKTR